MPATTDPPENQGDGRTRSRLESEIEEILERAEREHPLPPPISIDDARHARDQEARREARRDQFRQAGESARRWLTAAPILVAFMFAILAKMFENVSPLLAQVAVTLAVIAFFWPIFEHIRNRNTAPTATMWRGRDMSAPRTEPSPFEQIRTWLRNRRILP